jgi:preprotein translocase subunit SecG
MLNFFFLLGALAILCSVALIFAVTIQNSKGGGLSSSFGGTSSASQILGSRRSNEFIEKFTWYLFAGLVALAFFANVIGTNVANADTSRLDMQESLNNADQAYVPGGVSNTQTYTAPPQQEGTEGGDQ